MTDPQPPEEDGDALTTLGRVNRMLSRAPDHVDPDVADVVDAINTFVPTFTTPSAADGSWESHQRLGAAMLGARLYRRKDSPGGMASFGLEGGASYVAGNWPDIAMLLGLGNYAVGHVG